VSSIAHDLETLGWTAERDQQFEPYAAAGLVAGRVGAQHRGACLVYSKAGEFLTEPSGKLEASASGAADLPAVGDWVAFRPAAAGSRGVVHAVLPRRASFSRARRDLARRTPQAAERQVLVANVDVAFLVTGLVGDLNLRRLERYLASAWESGSEPVVVLTKRDLVADLEPALAAVEQVAIGVAVHAVSNVTGEGLDAVRALVGHGRTAALLGSSGAGKSSLVNRLLGRDAQVVREVRADGRGRHTTSHRELFLLPGGGLVVDTPGLRVIEPWASEGLETAFGDLEELAAGCRFRDCRHAGEPGCAVQEAIDAGALDEERLDGFRKLERELAFLERRGDPRAQDEERRRWRAVSRDSRQRQRQEHGWRE
jgi:ribosome biogenesis GTPase / thiamine phosphate phosphatase